MLLILLLPTRAFVLTSPIFHTGIWIRGHWHCHRTRLGSACPRSKANLLTPGGGEGKCSTYCRRQARSQGSLVLKRPELPEAFRGRFIKTGGGRGLVGCVISSWTFFWLVGGEVIRGQLHPPSGSNWSGGYVLVGSIQLTSSTWWGFQYLPKSSKDLAQNIIYIPWGGMKGPWFCLMARLLLFCLAWLLFFLSAFSHFSD